MRRFLFFWTQSDIDFNDFAKTGVFALIFTLVFVRIFMFTHSVSVLLNGRKVFLPFNSGKILEI